MRNTVPTRSAAAIFLSLILAATVAAQTTKPATRPLELPDPTPRPDDLQLRYGDTAANRKHSAPRMDAQHRASNRKQVEQATDLILLLAGRLKNDFAIHGVHAPAELTVRRADQIETLAKMVPK